MLKFKKTITALLVMTMLCMTLAGCKGGAKQGNVELSPYVYVPEFKVLEDVTLSRSVIIGDMVYATGSEYEENKPPVSYLYSIKMGETQVNRVVLDVDENTSISEIVADNSGNIKAIFNTYLYEEGAMDPDSATEEDGTEEGAAEGDAAAEKDGTAEEGTAEEGAAEEEADTEEEGTEEVAEEGVSSSGGGTVIIGGGGATMMSSTSTATSVIGGNDEYVAPIGNKLELVTIGTDGSFIERADITGLFEDPQNVYFQYVSIDGEDNVYLSMDQKIKVIDKAGKSAADISIDQGMWVNNMFSLSSGKVAIAVYNNNGYIEFRQVDLQKKAIGESSGELEMNMYGNMKFGTSKNSDVLISSGNGLYSYTWGEKPVEILQWINSDINSDEVEVMTELEDGRIMAVIVPWNRSDGETTELAYLTKTERSKVQEKELITLGTLSMGQDLQKSIIDFNKKSQTYRVEVKDYLVNDYNEATTQMNADIVSGKCPDIISLGFGNSLTQYTAKGLLEDLNPFFEKDEEIKKEDYLENILNAYSVDGKLYAVGTRFYVNTIIGKQSVLGDKKSITVQELMEISKNAPEGASLYEYATKDSVLTNSLAMNMDSYIDWQTGKCNFNQQEFMDLLEFANTFPKEFDFNQERKLAENLRSDKLLMVNATISSVQEYQMYEGMFGEPIAFVGYPTTKENGSGIAMAGTTLAMSSKSKVKEGAWAFIREGLTEKAQESEDGEWGFPIRKASLEAKFEKDMTKEYYEDANGEKKEQMKTSWGYDDFNIDIYAANEEQVNIVRDLIGGLTSVYEYNEQIYNIVTEEVAPYFEGQKSVKEVVDIIQSRVQIYVNENR